MSDGGPTVDGGIHPLWVVFNWIKYFVGQPKASELESLNLTKLLADLYKIGLLIPFEIDYLCKTLGMLVTQKTNYAYPSIIFAIGIRSFINKEFHCHHTRFFNCNVQGRLLMERLKQCSGQ